MSKSSVKKELSLLNREQLIEVVLTAYQSNKAVKDYFDFFAEPDVDKLYDRYIRDITKEIIRGKRNRSTARISRIRKSIKDFESLNPGAEPVIKLRLQVIEMLITQESIREYSDTLINGTLKLLNDTIEYAEKNELVSTAMSRIVTMTAECHDSSRHFRDFLRRNIQPPGQLCAKKKTTK